MGFFSFGVFVRGYFIRGICFGGNIIMYIWGYVIVVKVVRFMLVRYWFSLLCWYFVGVSGIMGVVRIWLRRLGWMIW